MEARRIAAVDRFALKIADNPRYAEYFPLRPAAQCRSRVSQMYLEEHARTSRMYNSPFFYMRHRLNTLHRDGQAAARAVRSTNVVQGPSTNGGQTGAAGTTRCDFIFDEWR